MIDNSFDPALKSLLHIESLIADEAEALSRETFEDLANTACTLRLQLQDLSKRHLNVGKIFVAIDGNNLIVESTAKLDVVSINLTPSTGCAKLQQESLSPLSEQDFLETVSDTLADLIQRGVVSPLEINNIK